MATKPPKDIDTGERAAITDEIRDEVTAEFETPAPVRGISSETIRRLARNEARPIARDEMREHAYECEHKGPLCSVSEKVDRLRASSSRQNGALALLTLLGPIILGIWLNSRANDRLTQQMQVAADVARQLKAVQDAAKGAP